MKGIKFCVNAAVKHKMNNYNMDISNFKNKTNKVFIIAEAGSNHLKSLKRAYKLVDIAKESGADAIKFQSFSADEIATKNKRYNKIHSKFKKYSNNLYNFYKNYELPINFNFKINNYCKKEKNSFYDINIWRKLSKYYKFYKSNHKNS